MRYSRFFIPILFGLAVLLTASWVCAAESGVDAELFGKVIRSIQFFEVRDTGDRPLESAHYEGSIGLDKGGRLTRTGLKRAIQALYDTGSFSDIAVSAVPVDDGVQVQFHLRLSTYFNRFFISKGVDLGGRSPAEAIGLPVGERFSDEKLEEARQSVLKYMKEKGYYQSQVTSHSARLGDSALVDTTFDVHPGELATIRSLVIQGVPPQETAAIRQKLGMKEGQKYQRDRFLKRLNGLKTSLVGRGFLDAELNLKGDPEYYQPSDNSIALDLSIANFGQVRIEVDGFKIPKNEQRRLLPVLSGEGLSQDLVNEGSANLKEYLEERGYPEAVISIPPITATAGVRLLRYIVDRGRRVLVSAVRFRNNKAVTDVELLNAFQIQPSRFWQRFTYSLTRIDSFLQKSTYSVSKLDSDKETLLSLYKSKGYLDATVVRLVEPVNNGERVRLTFECAEGIQALAGSITINGSPPAEALVKLGLEKDVAETLPARIYLKSDRPYSPSFTKHDRQVILAAFNDAGFLQTSVSYRVDGPDSKHAYTVDFQVKGGVRSRIDKIVVLGRNRTRNSVVEKRIKLKRGEPLSLGKMLETQQALYSTGVFDLVRVEPQNPEGNAPYQNVIVRLQETRPLTLRYGIGYQEREKVRGILELSDLNIFGMGQSVDFLLRGSAIEQAGILSFKQPQVRFLPVDSYFTFSGSKKKEISFDERRFDLSYQYSHPINNHSWNMLRYSFTNVRVSNEPSDLAREERPRNLSTFSAFYLNDTRDNYEDRNAKYLDPQKGFFTSTDLSFTVNHGGGGYYFSVFSQNSYYRRLPGHLQIASSFRLGLLLPIGGDTSIPVGQRVPISERFFAGGGSSLRGFSTDMAGPLGLSNEPIGGNALLIGNLELRIPLVSRLELAGFYDGGNVFPTLGDIRLSGLSHTVGVGLRVKTPFGPIRIDYGFNLNLSSQLRSLGYKQGHFFLTIGPPF